MCPPTAAVSDVDSLVHLFCVLVVVFWDNVAFQHVTLDSVTTYKCLDPLLLSFSVHDSSQFSLCFLMSKLRDALWMACVSPLVCSSAPVLMVLLGLTDADVEWLQSGVVSPLPEGSPACLHDADDAV